MGDRDSTLVVAAHCDDEVLGCGGTIAGLADRGQTVHIAILGEGITSRYAQREFADPQAVQDLSEHSRKAARVLGAASICHFGLPDNRFDSLPLLDIVKIIEDLIDRYHPTAIYTQHGGDLNVDHVAVHRAVLTATRPVRGSCVKHLYAYPVGSSTEWAFAQFEPVFRPNHFVNIEHTLERKVHAMEQYASETRPFPHPRSPEALRATAAHWGSMVGVPAAEAFQVVRQIV